MDLFNHQGAVFSEDRVYRYRLWRHPPDTRFAAFIGLNPSTADETQNDPTVTRCIGFARSWGLAGMEMLNLYGFRSTDPDPMFKHSAPIGPGNDEAILAVAREASIVIGCWGAFPQARIRAIEVHRMLSSAGIVLHALQLTSQGWPRHPLYLCRDREPFPWRIPAG